MVMEVCKVSTIVLYTGNFSVRSFVFRSAY